MILSCNSCEKKFVIPDNAIGPSGRLVQCSSCGNKWRQLPVIAEKRSPNKTTTKAKEKISKINKKNKEIKIIKKKVKKKKDGPNLYSPEYLAKKHGILLGNWYDTVIAPRDINMEKTGYHTGECPKAEKLSSMSINLPTNIHVSVEDAIKISSIVNNYVSS